MAPSRTARFPCLRSVCPYPRLSVRKSLESRVVIVPSKSVKKMNLGFVRMAGRLSIEGAMMVNWMVVGGAERCQSIYITISTDRQSMFMRFIGDVEMRLVHGQIADVHNLPKDSPEMLGVYR